MRHSSGKMEAFTIFHSCLNLLILLLHVSGQSLITPGGHSKDTDLEVCTGLIDKMQRIKMKIEKFQELERKLGQMQGMKSRIKELYWKEKETHILTFQISELLYEQILSWYQQFIPTNTED